MTPLAQDLVVDDFTFQVRRSSRRQTMQITVDRNGELVFAAPEECPVSKMEEFVREKRGWIYTKLAEKEAQAAPNVAREYVTGEGFQYLGRNHRLQVVESGPSVQLVRGKFVMSREAVVSGRAHLVRWYTERAESWLTQRLERWAGRMGAIPEGIRVQDLGFRWGSCSADGCVQFHWKTICLPPPQIDYVIVHELAHLHERNHSADFWLRVERALPDFAARKQWLAERGGEFGQV